VPKSPKYMYTGIGYHLTLVKNSSGRQKNITSVIRHYVPNVRKEPRVGSELNYLLPHESSPVFEELFHALEQNRAKLGIDSFGASVTTMEEVFIKYIPLSFVFCCYFVRSFFLFFFFCFFSSFSCSSSFLFFFFSLFFFFFFFFFLF